MLYKFGLWEKWNIASMTSLKREFAGKRYKIARDSSLHFALSFVERSTFHKMHEHMILFYFQADKSLNDTWVVYNIQFVNIFKWILILSFPIKKPPISLC